MYRRREGMKGLHDMSGDSGGDDSNAEPGDGEIVSYLENSSGS
jgi:hypothetical protein